MLRKQNFSVDLLMKTNLPVDWNLPMEITSETTASLRTGGEEGEEAGKGPRWDTATLCPVTPAHGTMK